LDKAEEIVGVVLPANEDPALPLNLTFCAIFARLYPSPIYSPENTLWFVGASLLVGLIGGGFLAWRWLAVTGLVFAGLVGVNELYVHLLEPIGY